MQRPARARSRCSPTRPTPRSRGRGRWGIEADAASRAFASGVGLPAERATLKGLSDAIDTQTETLTLLAKRIAKAVRTSSGGLPGVQAKGLHLALHSVAILAVLFGLVTVVQSHTLKRPTPMNDMYSSHSYLGALAAFLFLLQYAAAFAVYWLEGFKAYRKPLLAAHRALGFVVWSLGRS